MPPPGSASAWSSTEERDAASLPTVIVEDAEFAQEILDCCNGDWCPPTMEEDFKALWGV